MLRFILRHDFKCQHSGAVSESFITVDGDTEQVEWLLKTGGFSETGYDLYHLLGVEIVED